MRFSESIANIAQSLCYVQAEIKNPIKTQTNKGVQGAPKYASLESTLQEFVRPVLAKYGMSLYQSLKSDDSGRVGVCTVLFHESGEYIESDYVYCDIIIPTNKEGAEILTRGQATGVNITYLRRYSLNAALGINGDKDTDGVYEQSADTTGEPMTYEAALDLIIAFGKHKGQSLREIYKSDRPYIDWLANGEKTNENVKTAITIIEKEIKKRTVKETP